MLLCVHQTFQGTSKHRVEPVVMEEREGSWTFEVVSGNEDVLFTGVPHLGRSAGLLGESTQAT